jgi:beta-lactam-binding protein with PASTA domain
VAHRDGSSGASHVSMSTGSSSGDAPIVSFVADGPPGTMPDFQGMSAREALRKLVRLGVTARVDGNGFVVAQDPPAGTALESVGQCRLTLDRFHAPQQDGARP